VRHAETIGARSSGVVLFSLCYRLGYESGTVRRCMTSAGISWGNYMDHVMEPHNNCHPNNLVILPPSAGSGYAAAAAAARLATSSAQRGAAAEAASCGGSGELIDESKSP